MNSVVEDTLNKLKQCDDFHNRCDCLLEHSEITYLLNYIQQKENIIKEVREFIYKCNDGKQGINYSGCSKLLEILDKEVN